VWDDAILVRLVDVPHAAIGLILAGSEGRESQHLTRPAAGEGSDENAAHRVIHRNPAGEAAVILREAKVVIILVIWFGRTDGGRLHKGLICEQ